MGYSYRQFEAAEILTVINLIKDGAEVAKVCGRDGHPSKSTFYRSIDADPQLSRAYAEALTARRINKE